jgi:hypothetical protein
MSRERVLFLARDDESGVVVDLLDGPHSDEEGVAKAAKLFRTIFNDPGPWKMVEIHPLPKGDPPTNEDAAQTCREILQ